MVGDTRERVREWLNQFPIYHGTYSKAIPGIREHGLHPSLRPWDIASMQRLSELFIKSGWDNSPWYDKDHGTICATIDRDVASSYANDAPEFWHLTGRMRAGINRNGQLTDQEVREAERRYAEFEQHFSGKTPWLVRIDPAAPPLALKYHDLALELSVCLLQEREVSSAMRKHLGTVFINEPIAPEFLQVEEIPQGSFEYWHGQRTLETQLRAQWWNYLDIHSRRRIG